MYKYIFLILFYFIQYFASAQLIQGQVLDEKQQPLIGATILEIGTQNGAITDLNGRFELELTSVAAPLTISFTGYLTDTLSSHVDSPLSISLMPDVNELEEITVSSSSTFIDSIEPMHREIISEPELAKAACCNLSESFETNAAVDVSFTDAVSGAKTIRMLGLDGRYVQINRENAPHIRGLLGRYGLLFVPGTWIQSIDLGKGAGSVVNGYESMVGQINLELKKPDSEKLYLNVYANNFGNVEFNANHAFKVNEKWSTAILLHSHVLDNSVDNNKDGFLDIPRSRMINMMNRYHFKGDKLVSQIGFQLTRDERIGGQEEFDYGNDLRSSPFYGFENNTTRAEVFGKVGLLFPHKPYKGWGFIYSYSYFNSEGGFGRNLYEGEESALHGNLIYQNIMGDSKHQYKTGASLLYDDFAEVYSDSAFSRQEVVPGIFYEYSFLPSDQWTVVVGARTDFHNLYGNFYTPRAHVKYALSDNFTLRAAGGRGFRTPNVVLENMQVLVSNRSLIVQEEIKPEVSWNTGLSVVTGLPMADRKLIITVDYFYTSFENQMVSDRDASSTELRIYNLNGQSFAHSFQIEASMAFTENLNIKTAYKLYDVQTTIDGRLMSQPMIARDRFFLNIGYETKYEKWQADATLQWVGRKRLPDTRDKAAEFQRNRWSDDFALLNLQLTRNYRWGSVYLGSENLMDFKQDAPVIDAENPFGNEFDASIVWAPIVGRKIYAGLRYKIKS